MDRSLLKHLPIAIVGAGPVGLAAAAHLLALGEEPLVFESGPTVGTAMLAWGHVRLFSPWRYVVDGVAEAMLAETGWVSPDPDLYPTGRDVVEQYLEPLAAIPALRSRLRLGSRVVQISRDGFDKMKSPGRDAAPFLLVVCGPAGRDELVRARAVIDATGTWGTPNPLGGSGIPALGEAALADRIADGIPDPFDADRDTYVGRRVLVVGSGHSAFNVLLDLVDLADEAPGTAITWAIRRPSERLGHLFGGGAADALPARGALGVRVRRLIDDGRVRLVTGFSVARLTDTEAGIVVAAEDQVLPPVDRIVAATGFRPDLTLLAELRLDLDPAVESPAALAPLIDPNLHSCGSVPPHGEAELRQPESGLYVVGMKSYGRAPTFLMITGYEQVRSIACALAGDIEGARDVRLVLPETGVCSSGILETPAAISVEAAPCCSLAAVDLASPTDTRGSAATASGCRDSRRPEPIQLTGATRGAHGG